MSQSKSTSLFLLYLVALIMMYPIIAYFNNSLGTLYFNSPHAWLWAYIHIFLSGPVLVLIGFLLYFIRPRWTIHRILGCVCLVTGLLWIAGVIIVVSAEVG